jgi:hypothetical protein
MRFHCLLGMQKNMATYRCHTKKTQISRYTLSFIRHFLPDVCIFKRNNHHQLMENIMTREVIRSITFTTMKLFVVFCIAASQADAADNPCGVNCTQSIATTTATNIATTIATNISTTISDNAINNAINTRIYEKNVIFAETALNITTGGGTQWAFGDGDTGAIGIPLPESWELYAVSLQARSVTANATVVINILNINDGSTIYQITAPLTTPVPPAINGVYTQMLATPVAIPAGSTIGFSTVSVSAGIVTGARIGAWLRRHPN